MAPGPPAHTLGERTASRAHRGRPAFLRELLDLGEEEAPESPLDTLGEAVSRAAKREKDHRPVIQVKPPAREEKR